MHETRNLIVIILLLACIVWAAIGWFVFDPQGALIWVHRLVPTSAAVVLAIWCFYALNIEDKLPDYLARQVGTTMYFEADGLSFLPAIRVNEDGQAEVSLYYQNRYENYVQAIVHLRPPEDSFIIRPGMRDMHFAFKAEGGDFGVLHQPIGVPRHLQGDIIEIELAAATRFPRSHGLRLRRHEGLPCGTFRVDWMEAFKIGVHEVAGEIELEDPCKLHLSMPREVNETIVGSDVWRQEMIEAGPPEYAVMG